MAKEATSLPYDWLESIPQALAKKDAIPLVGYPPAFPFDEVADQIKMALDLSSLVIEASAPKWRESAKLFTSMAGELYPYPFSVPGLEGKGWLVVTEKDIAYLMALVLTKKSTAFPVQDPEFQEGFSTFLAAEILNAIGSSSFDPNFAPQLLSDKILPSEDSLCVDVTVTVKRKKIKSRLFISKELQAACRRHFAKKGEEKSRAAHLSHKLNVELQLEIGRTSIPQESWDEVNVGDFIVLDKCSWDPDEQKGRVSLNYQNTPLFRGRLKRGKIKILEFPLYQEVDTMSSNIPEDEESEEMTLEEESEIEPEESEIETEEGEVEAHVDEEEAHEEESEMEFEEEEKEEEEEPVEEVAEAPPPAEEVEAPDEPTEGIGEAAALELASSGEIPFTVVVEAGRLNMTVEKLSDLHPGNILDLNIRPEAGVDMVINGHCVAKGELLRIGETLGVRVLEIG